MDTSRNPKKSANTRKIGKTYKPAAHRKGKRKFK